MFIMNYKSKIVFFYMSPLLEYDLALPFNFRLRILTFIMANLTNMVEGWCSYCCYFCSSLLSFFLSFFKNMIYHTLRATEQVWIIFIKKKFQTLNESIAHHITLLSVLPRESGKHIRSSQLL